MENPQNSRNTVIASLKLNIEDVEGNGMWTNPWKKGKSERFVPGQKFTDVVHNTAGLIDELEKIMGHMDKIFASTGYPRRIPLYICGMVLKAIVLVLIFSLRYHHLHLGHSVLICSAVIVLGFVLQVLVHKNTYNSRKTKLNACMTTFNDNHKANGLCLAFNEDYDAYASYLINRRLWGQKCCLTNPEEVWNPALLVKLNHV